ncbi:MAG: pilus assembly protein [Candidatus Binataceae bacterium]|nr:pilus assembly protein [Candidatus Binataceae bacterium]
MNKLKGQKALGGQFGRGLRADGQSSLELAIAIPILAFLLLAAADFSRVFYLSIGVNNAARAGAQYGSQSVITAADTNGMEAATKTDGANIAGLSATASQCTCAAASSVAACPANYCTNAPLATFVEVDAQAVFHTLVNYPGIPASTTLSAKAIMQVEQ